MKMIAMDARYIDQIQVARVFELHTHNCVNRIVELKNQISGFCINFSISKTRTFPTVVKSPGNAIIISSFLAIKFIN